MVHCNSGPFPTASSKATPNAGRELPKGNPAFVAVAGRCDRTEASASGVAGLGEHAHSAMAREKTSLKEGIIRIIISASILARRQTIDRLQEYTAMPSSTTIARSICRQFDIPYSQME